ncbi:hypothetical protein DFH09DRAFT_1417683 [Mycena vulgaris]|nr:hypothetical protein DFH09DRAFT_1417683 [Mycena vulgaris]
MASVVGLLRGCYVPQFVLGGLTRIVGPVVLRYATTAASSVFFKEDDTSTTASNHAKVPGTSERSDVQFPAPPISTLAWFDIQCPASTIHTPISVEVPNHAEVEIPGAELQFPAPPMSTPTWFATQCLAASISVGSALEDPNYAEAEVPGTCFLAEQAEVQFPAPPMSPPTWFSIQCPASTIHTPTLVETPNHAEGEIPGTSEPAEVQFPAPPMSTPTWFATQCPAAPISVGSALEDPNYTEAEVPGTSFLAESAEVQFPAPSMPTPAWFDTQCPASTIHAPTSGLEVSNHAEVPATSLLSRRSEVQRSMSIPAWFDTQCLASTVPAPTSVYLPYSVIQVVCPLKRDEPSPTSFVQSGTQHLPFTMTVSHCFAFLEILAICPLDLIPANPNPPPVPVLALGVSSVLPIASQTIDPSLPASSILAHSMTAPQTIDSYLFSPLMLSQLFVVCLALFIVSDMDWWRSGGQSASEPEGLPNKDLAAAPAEPIRPQLRRKPSDAADWRVPRNHPRNSVLETETLQTPTAPPRREYSPSTPQTKFDPAHDYTAHREATATPPATPTYATYVPPHRRASFDFGTRRPLAEVGNGVGTPLSSKPGFEANPKLRRRSSAQAVLSPTVSHKLNHRTGFPVDPTPTRRHTKQQSINRFVTEDRRNWTYVAPLDLD